MARVVLPESGLRARRRRRRALLIVGLWAVCLGFFGGLIALSHASMLRIGTVEIQGGQTVAKEALEKSVWGGLAGRYLYLVPRDNIFVYPKEELAASLMSTYPTLKHVEVRAENFSTIAVVAEDRQPRALWCGESFARAEPCRLLDEDGVAYAAAPDFSENPFVRYYGALREAGLPAQFLNPENFRALAALVDALAQAEPQEQIEGVMVDAEGDARLRFVSGFALLFALDDSGGDVFERYALARGAEPFAQQPLGSFEYLDLRFGDKLYFKIKQAIEPAEQKENTPTPEE
jgi:hypothetical protein